MAANDSVVVKIVGDASGVQPAVEETSSSLGGLEGIVASLSAQMKSFTASMMEGFTSGAAGAKELSAGLEEAKVAAAGAGAGVEGMVLKIHEGAESIRTFQMRAKEFAEAYVAMFAGEQVADFINKMAEAAEKVEHLAQTFGMSNTQIQQLQGIATATGIPVDALTKGMQMLDRNMANAAMGSRTVKQAMDAVGVSMNDGRTQMEKLEVVADKFANMADGPKKVALAMQLFGRSGAQLIPVLDLGSQGIQQLNEKMTQYGVTNDVAVEKGIALAENVNEAKLAFEGLSNTLMEALAPAFIELVQNVNATIQSFVQSYDAGGSAKQVMEALSGTVELCISVFNAFGQVLSAIGKAFDDMSREISGDSSNVFGQQVPKNLDYTQQAFLTLKKLVEFVRDGILVCIIEIELALNELADVSQAAGHVIVDALTFNWGSIDADWQAGLKKLGDDVEATKNRVVALAQDMKAAFTGQLTWRDLPQAPLNSDSLYGGVELPKASGSGFDYNPTGPKKKPKKPKDDLVQKLQEELEEKKTAWDEEQLAQDTAQQYSLDSEAAFWKAALDRTDLSAKDKMEIEKKYTTAALAAQKQAEDEKLALMKREITEDDKNWTKKIADVKAWAAEVHRFYGDRSKEAEAADQEVVNIEKQAAAASRAAWDEYYKTLHTLALDRITDAEAQAKFEEQMGLESKAQLLAQERDFENQRYAIQVEELNREKALIDPNRDPAAYQKICDQIEVLERQHQNKLNEIDRQAVLERTAIERTALQSISQNWADAIGKMVTLQQTFAATVKSLWQTIQQAIGTAIASILQRWLDQQLAALLLGKTQKVAEATGEVGANAAVAASGAYAATAAIPIVGPELAPAAAATAYAGALSWLGSISMAGFDVGAWNLSKDQVAMVHAGEMIIPPDLAGGMRGFFQNVNDNARPAANDMGSSGDGAPHLHFHGPIIGSRSAMEQWARENRHMFGAGMREYLRRGGSGDPYRTR